MSSIRRLKIAFFLLTCTLLFGIMGYRFIEGMTLFESLYMTVITISTVGFMEVRPLSASGRIVTMVLISTGIIIGAYTLGSLLRMLIEGELRQTFSRRKVERMIASMKNHYIICGYGRIGRLICRELHSQGIDYVVIENDPEMLEELEREKILYLSADATDDESLIQAGIMNASGLVTAVKSDSDNVYITLTARGIRQDILIVARSSDERSESKLLKAGATRVVSPYLIGGKRMAQILTRPTVVDFIDIAVMEGKLGLMMEEARVKEGSPLVGKNLIESNLRRDYGVIIVLIKKHNGTMIFNPLPVEVLEQDDVIVLLGETEHMKRLRSVI
ncbi:MAG: potassium channel protein [Spirochaetes bacterium]|nr:potassium channel protein [Spirochaetota bacterium]